PTHKHTPQKKQQNTKNNHTQQKYTLQIHINHPLQNLLSPPNQHQKPHNPQQQQQHQQQKPLF
ncbi:hypothetical protein DF186_14395, partial [Enterococcus hirae]